ncbi:uncharacterized protein LOC135343749 [Halichondria panicea]|uniref:uncharacterized protein LOC135343749 n=1 Tax=Halichondria panicea TaxID=6063 RepID=UPI00312B9AA1
MAKKLATVYFLCLLSLFIITHFGEAAQCTPESDPKYLCTARCNGTSFDLSKAFDFPMKITEPTARGGTGNTYWYTWDPCHIVKCPGYPAGTDIAVCQSANFFYNCGRNSKSIWLLSDRLQPQENFPNWQVEYTFGIDWRITIFNFTIDHTVEEPTVKFISEDPELQYNFEVRGKCIGQESFDCKQYYESRNKLKDKN